MDRKAQLGNVAFGGSWVEAIEEREWLRRALDLIDQAAAECMERDMRSPDLRAALDDLAGRIARGRLLADAYWRALGLDPGRRQAEVQRIRCTLISAVGKGEVE